jgi:hypothetical protein
MTPILGIMASQISGHLETGAYESISTVTVGGGGSATITFSSIPGTYTHLQVMFVYVLTEIQAAITLAINFRAMAHQQVHLVHHRQKLLFLLLRQQVEQT